MKKCTWCGREYPDDATQCAIDARPLEGGPPPPRAQAMEDPAPATTNSADDIRAIARKNMIVGALWCGGGLLVTFLTYGAATSDPNGGTYVVAWGAIVFGAIQFFRGLVASNATGPTATPIRPSQPADAPTAATKPSWTCSVCGELSEMQYTSCWKCNTPRQDIAQAAATTHPN